MMKKLSVAAILVSVLLAAPANAVESRVALGVFTLIGGMDLQLSFRPEQSHWMFGFRYLTYVEEFEDPFTGRVLDETDVTMTGPIVTYLIDIDSNATWYFGASMLSWSQKLREEGVGGQSDEASTTAPFLGGGYMGKFGGEGYYNVGIFLSGAELTLETANTFSEETGIDVQAQLGFVF
jgi:hypothetical protein